MELSISIVDNATPMLAAMQRRLPDALAAGTEDAATLVLREQKIYPTQRPPLTGRRPYKRTGTLGRSWFKIVRRVNGGATARIYSSGQIAPYNIWVQSAALQARVHRGHWLNTDVGTVERLRPQIVALYDRRIGAALAVAR